MMAGPDQSPIFFLLEDELTCSICLSTFDCPVTIPCGHNFCQNCLLDTWKDSKVHRCPQCRTLFAVIPDLKKNTVLSTVVQTFNMQSSTQEIIPVVKDESKAQKDDVIRCDTCIEALASQTCLTCMASFCEEHLRPHLENPVFRLHQLNVPVSDLLERICPDHPKLMEFFCSQHVRPICSICLQQVHKGCTFVSHEEQRKATESDLRDKLGLLDGKITKTESATSQMDDMKSKLVDLATNRKKALAADYQLIMDMLTREECDALNAVDQELENGQTKLKNLIMKFTENADSMSKAREHIQSLLGQSQTLAFLQVSFDLPPATNFNPHIPRIHLDSKNVVASETSTAALKKHLTEIFKLPIEARLDMLKADEKEVPASGSTKSSLDSEKPQKQKQKRAPRSHSPGGPPLLPHFQIYPGPPGYPVPGGKWFPFPYAHIPPPRAGAMNNPQKTSDDPVDITSTENRNDLVKYATTVKLDIKTTHRRIVVSEGFTKATVSDEENIYPDFRERFAVCSQVLACSGFSRGRHYWEVRLSINNFIGIGLSYSSIDRKGPASRLGRNAQSWCVEWFNGKLSAWHNSSETVLANHNSKRVGVMLDCDEGTVTFYSVSGKAQPIHSFVFPFAEKVYPAFWIFSSGSFISLCKPQA